MATGVQKEWVMEGNGCEKGLDSGKALEPCELSEHAAPVPLTCVCRSAHLLWPGSVKTEKKEPPAQDPCRNRRGNLDMKKLCSENEGKPEKEGKAEDKIEPEDEGKTEKEEKPDHEGKPAHEGKLEGEGEPDVERQGDDEGKAEIQSKLGDEGKPQGEGVLESQAQPASKQLPAEKHLAEGYVPRKAKRKTDRGTEDSPKDSQENIQDSHLSREEMMREFTDVSKGELRSCESRCYHTAEKEGKVSWPKMLYLEHLIASSHNISLILVFTNYDHHSEKVPHFAKSFSLLNPITTFKASSA
ncbi:Transcription elongation factor A protein-like 3 [Heterocephalus glaber]|uniref:Transcription elongation factor A protein-like 3 n=1 Tax=Heterocephalus glaber TaxID=10181 RepID=G5C6Z2_HETGA|nr:Transcription elongation factor A protein-like 3 [Heterocephalus glaber]